MDRGCPYGAGLSRARGHLQVRIFAYQEADLEVWFGVGALDELPRTRRDRVGRVRHVRGGLVLRPARLRRQPALFVRRKELGLLEVPSLRGLRSHSSQLVNTRGWVGCLALDCLALILSSRRCRRLEGDGQGLVLVWRHIVLIVK